MIAIDISPTNSDIRFSVSAADKVAELIKEEDINAVPENTDVSEIDKLTGIPKPKGKLDYVNFLD